MPADLIHDMVARERWEEGASALARLPREQAAEFIASLADEQQQALFQRLPVDAAAQILVHFPYYLQYVLLHTRDRADMRAILDEIPPGERMQLFDELPEEAWQRLEEEIGDLLFAASNLARYLGSDPESCLRRANQKFKSRFQVLEREVNKLGKRVRDCTPEELDRLWNAAKQEARSNQGATSKEQGARSKR